MTVADALVKALSESSLSDVQIAAQLGVAESTVGRWRRGKGTPRAQQFMALCQILPEFAALLNGKAA